MSKDSERSHVHLAMPRTALLFEDWNKHKLEFDDILVLPEHEPVNPEEEEDIVPDQHAAFGIAKSQQIRRRQAAWKDLSVKGLLFNGPNAVSTKEVLEFPNFSEVEEEVISMNQNLLNFSGSIHHDVDSISTPVMGPDPKLSPEILLQDARASARRASAMVTPTYNNDAQHVTTRNRTNAMRSSRLASGTQRRRAPR